MAPVDSSDTGSTGKAPVSPGLMGATRRCFPGASIGNFYGTTALGGANSEGTVFKLSSSSSSNN